MTYIDQLAKYYFEEVKLRHPVANETSISGFSYEDGFYLWNHSLTSPINTISLVKKVFSLGGDKYKVQYNVYVAVDTEIFALRDGTCVPQEFYSFTEEQASDSPFLVYRKEGEAILKKITLDEGIERYLLCENRYI